VICPYKNKFEIEVLFVSFDVNFSYYLLLMNMELSETYFDYNNFGLSESLRFGEFDSGIGATHGGISGLFPAIIKALVTRIYVCY